MTKDFLQLFGGQHKKLSQNKILMTIVVIFVLLLIIYLLDHYIECREKQQELIENIH